MIKPYPGRFMVFTQLGYSPIDDPNFGDEMVALLDDSVARGARGLKDPGLGGRDKSGKLVIIDDARLDPVWEERGRLRIPGFIHSGVESLFETILPTSGSSLALAKPSWDDSLAVAAPAS